jgi:gamma-D-glutamyl-L-lysine dipeptidyl-peptidase
LCFENKKEEKKKIMRYILIILIFFTIVPVYSQQSKSMNKIQLLISEVQKKYAPDKRTARFDISYEALKQKKLILSGETNLLKAKISLLNELKKNGYNVQDKISVLPDKKLGENIFGVIKISVATMRTKPKEAAEMASQALLGCSIKILKKMKGWVLIQTPDKYIAWMELSGYQPMNKAQVDEWRSSKKIIITKEYGFVFSKPDINSDHVSDLVAGDILKKLSNEGEFVKVEFPDKRKGYVLNNICKNFKSWLKSRNPNEKNIIKTAYRFMGIPYLWGGTSAKAMDCSGYTRTVFFLNGIYLPRDASQQVNIGRPVDTQNGFSNLKPGDLLFFGKKATEKTKEKITHVGIYIGNYEFINEAGRVKIDSFNKKAKNFSRYRLHQFIRAKRILTSIGKNGVELLKDVQY